MSASYKSFPLEIPVSWSPTKAVASHLTRGRDSQSRLNTVAEVLVCYVFILAAIWTESRLVQGIWMLAAASSVGVFVFRSRPSSSELGLRRSTPAGTVHILLVTALSVVLIFATTLLSGQSIPATPNWPTYLAMSQYVPWAILQEFILQSFFFLSLESIVGGKRAVWLCAILFAGAHIPNPVLTIATFFGALFFCDMFRRYRSLLLLGLVHAALGIALALCVPTPFIHHMRVGIGYLHFN